MGQGSGPHTHSVQAFCKDLSCSLLLSYGWKHRITTNHRGDNVENMEYRPWYVTLLSRGGWGNAIGLCKNPSDPGFRFDNTSIEKHPVNVIFAHYFSNAVFPFESRALISHPAITELLLF